MASFGLLSWTFSLFMPIWKPFMDWMAAWALPGLSKLTNPEGRRKRRRIWCCQVKVQEQSGFTRQHRIRVRRAKDVAFHMGVVILKKRIHP